MKWSNDELEIAIKLVKTYKSYSEIGEILNRSVSSVRNKLIKSGHSRDKYLPKMFETECLNCGSVFEHKKQGRERKFCSKSCSATFNNRNRKSEVLEKISNTLRNKDITEEVIKKCRNCYKEIKNNKKYCDQNCHTEFERKLIYEKIENGHCNIDNRIVKKYLIEKYGNKCMECGWNEINIYSGKIPIELEHIDGNSENNKLENLKLLCPNCHSLTPTYKALNKGNGRYKRMERYNNGKSY